MNETDPLQALDSFGSENHEGTTRATTALCVAATVVGVIGTVTLPFVIMPWVLGQNLPYMATPKGKLQKAFQFLSMYRQNHQRKALAGRQRFVDLGSGDGETVYQALQVQTSTLSAAKKDGFLSGSEVERQPYYFSQCTGIELNSTLYLWSCVRRLFWARDFQKRSQFRCRNLFYPSDRLLKEADAVFIFGIPSLMKPISQLLCQNCQSGTLILCYRFPLPIKNETSAQGENTEGNELLSAQLIYDQEEMRIYECTDKEQLMQDVYDS